MTLYGPRAGLTSCYQWSSMGPVLASQHATNGLAWAQCWPPSMLPMVACCEAQCWPPSVLPMVLHGPSASHQVCYRRPCMGPALATKRATDDLGWAQSWPHSMLLMVLPGPSTGPQSMLLMVLHGPSTGRQSMLPMVLTGPSAGHNSMLPMILHGPSASHQACY